MAVEISTSTISNRTKGEMVPEERAIMPADLFMAAIHGNTDFIVRHLGLSCEEQDHIEVAVETSEPVDTDQIPVKKEEKKVVYYNLESETSSGETILHILVAKKHNALAKKVFEKNGSLLNARNKTLQTPLRYAAKVGNVEIIQTLIQLASSIVKDALKETDDNNDTALHLAVKYGHDHVVRELLKLNHEVVNMVNKGGLSPFHIAIIESQNLVVEYMLVVDNSLACTQFSDGKFPIHVAAHIGNTKLVKHLLQKYPDLAELQDPLGRNFFHVAAEENKIDVFVRVFNKKDIMLLRMISAKDYYGNTPLHLAAIKGNQAIMRVILNNDVATEPNNKGLTPLDLSVIGRRNTILSNKWERSQLVGLGSVLITTVTFAAAFTIPGGYNSADGTPILKRRVAFWAFIMTNAFSFISAFISVLILVSGGQFGLDERKISSAGNMFLAAASWMVLAFGAGTYVMLSPVIKPIAITVLVLAFCAVPVAFIFLFDPKEVWRAIRAGKVLRVFIITFSAVLCVLGVAAKFAKLVM